MVPEITVQELAERLRGPQPPRVLDVRELAEWRLCRIAAAELRPMSAIREWIGELDKDDELIVQCHHGQRSWQVARYLQANGFQKVYNLRGGIDAWSRDIDATVPRY